MSSDEYDKIITLYPKSGYFLMRESTHKELGKPKYVEVKHGKRITITPRDKPGKGRIDTRFYKSKNGSKNLVHIGNVGYLKRQNIKCSGKKVEFRYTLTKAGRHGTFYLILMETDASKASREHHKKLSNVFGNRNKKTRLINKTEDIVHRVPVIAKAIDDDSPPFIPIYPGEDPEWADDAYKDLACDVGIGPGWADKALDELASSSDQKPKEGQSDIGMIDPPKPIVVSNNPWAGEIILGTVMSAKHSSSHIIHVRDTDTLIRLVESLART